MPRHVEPQRRAHVALLLASGGVGVGGAAAAPLPAALRLLRRQLQIAPGGDVVVRSCRLLLLPVKAQSACGWVWVVVRVGWGRPRRVQSAGCQAQVAHRLRAAWSAGCRCVRVGVGVLGTGRAAGVIPAGVVPALRAAAHRAELPEGGLTARACHRWRWRPPTGSAACTRTPPCAGFTQVGGRGAA